MCLKHVISTQLVLILIKAYRQESSVLINSAVYVQYALK